MPNNLDSAIARARQAREVFASGDGDPVPDYLRDLVRDDVPALLDALGRVFAVIRQNAITQANQERKLAEASRIVEAARAWRRDVDPRYGEASAEALCKLVDENADTADKPAPDQFDPEYAPATLGEGLTVTPGEWTPLDDAGTQIYLYGDRPADIVVQPVGDDLARQVDVARELIGTVRVIAETWRDDPGGYPDGAAEPMEQIATVLLGPRGQRRPTVTRPRSIEGGADRG